jgi:uncharacterized protein YndB with AHSA1/START domain
MTQATEPTTVTSSIEVAASVQRAFEVFTRNFGAFKPATHNLLSVPIAETVVETHPGGHIIDRGTDGSECRWARILAFEPPDRLMFSWDISPHWSIESDPARSSEVEVTFTALAEDRTRVVIEHRHLDRHGDGWTAVREGVGTGEGWPLYLDRYAELLTR